MTPEERAEIQNRVEMVEAMSGADTVGVLEWYLRDVPGLLEMVDQQGRELDAISKQWASFQEENRTLHELKNENTQRLQEQVVQQENINQLQAQATELCVRSETH